MGNLNRTASVSFVFVGICLLLFVSGTFSQARGATYTVNTNADNTTPDNFLTLREAIMIAKAGTNTPSGSEVALGPLRRCLTRAERNQISGPGFCLDNRLSNSIGPGCWNTRSCGSSDDAHTLMLQNPDTIVFTNAVTTINLTSPLPTLGINDSINGMTPGGMRVTIDGAGAGSGANGLTLNVLPQPFFCESTPSLSRTANNISNLIIINFSAHGIDGMSVQGGSFQGLDISGNGGSGIFLHAVSCKTAGGRTIYFGSHSNLIGGSQASQRNFIFSNKGHGIDIDVDPSFPNPAAHNNRIEGNFIGSAASNDSQWLQIDFNGRKTIEEINVITLQDDYENPVEPTESMTFTLYGAQDFQVEYWNASSASWVLVPVPNQNPVRENNRVWRRFRFSPLTTDKIRVVITRTPMRISRIVELEAIGCPAR